MKNVLYSLALLLLTQLAMAQNNGTCRINLIKEHHSNQKTKTYRIAANSKFRQGTSTNRSSEVQMLYLSSGRSGSITVDGTELKITCYKRQNMFEIDIDLVGAKDGIATSLTLGKGTKTNIGEIVKDLNSEARKLDANFGIEKNNMNGKRTTTYYLEVK